MLALLTLCVLIGCKGDAKEGSAAQRNPAAAACTGFSGSSAYSYARAQVDFGPRVPGTEAAQKAGDWIIRQMRSRADTVIVQALTCTTADGRKLPRRNSIARLRPGLADRLLYV